MEIKQLEYMTAAAEVGSFNKASEILYTTQSNVSKVIRGLEKDLGYPIFRRQGNGVVLTDAGRIIYEQAQEIMQMIRKIDAFSDIANKTCFHLASVPSNFLASTFAEFVSNHDDQGLCLKMWDGTMNYVIDLVDQREAELGFFYLSDHQCDLLQPLFQRKGIHFHKVIPARLEICVGPRHPLYSRECVEVEELKGLKYVITAEDNLSKTYHLPQIEQGLHLEEEMAAAVEVGSSYALMNLLMNTDRTDLCYGIINDQTRTTMEAVRTVHVNVDNDGIALGFIHKEDTPMSALAKEFVDLLIKVSNIELS